MLEKLLPTFIRNLPKYKGLLQKGRDKRDHLLHKSAMYLSETGGVYYAHYGYFNLYINCPDLNENFFEGTPSDILTVISETKKNKTQLSDEIQWAVQEGLLTPNTIREHHAPQVMIAEDGPGKDIPTSVVSDVISLSEYIKLFVSKDAGRPQLQGVCIHGDQPDRISFSATNGFSLINFRSESLSNEHTIPDQLVLHIEPFLALKKAKVDTVLECRLYRDHWIQITCLIGDTIVTMEYSAVIHEKFPSVDPLLDSPTGEYHEVDNRFLHCLNIPKRDFKRGYFSIPLVSPHEEDTYVLLHGGKDMHTARVHTAILLPDNAEVVKIDGQDLIDYSHFYKLMERANHDDAHHSCMDTRFVGDVLRLFTKYFDVGCTRVGYFVGACDLSHNALLRFQTNVEGSEGNYAVNLICAPKNQPADFYIECSEDEGGEEETE